MQTLIDNDNKGYRTSSEIYFDAADSYREAFSLPPACLHHPSAAPRYCPTERHLQCIWFDNNLRPAELKTQDGESVSVLSPGRWNLEAGPDFLDAILHIGGADARELRGDVEIHILPVDWQRHEHAEDPRYQSVIAHVTYQPANTSPKGLPTGTVEISLQESLLQKASFSMESVDLTAYPYAASSGSHPCADFLKACNQEKIIRLLNAAGSFRIEQKANRFSAQCRQSSPEHILYRETMAVLGYKQNCNPFRRLAQTVPFEMLQEMSAFDAYALLLGVSGLLPESPSPRWSEATRVFIRQIWDIWWPLRSRWAASRLSTEAWDLSSLRPVNHPIRRMAAAAVLFAGHQRPLLNRIEQMAISGNASAALMDLFRPCQPLDYWLSHLSLSAGRLAKPVHLIGKARANAWYNNLILPLLAATGNDVTRQLAALPPEQNNTVIKQAAHRLLGRDHNPSLYAASGLRQQGLIQIFHDFCLNARNGCAACQFPAFLRSN